MTMNNYTTAFQINSVVRSLKILSSAIRIEGLSEDELLSNLVSIHENHIQLSKLFDNEKIKLALILKRLCVLSSAINVNGLSKKQLLSTQHTIHENHIQLSKLLDEDRALLSKNKLEAV